MERQFDVSGIQNLPYEKLFQIAQEKFNQLDYEEAELYYQAAYNKKPAQDMIVLCYSHILKQNNKVEKAKNVLEKSLQENAYGTYKRYFELAQIYDAEDSINIFQRGIKKASQCLTNPFLSNVNTSQIKRDISQAYASIAEICMTDLAHLPYEKVQAKCIQVLQKGKQIDPTCMDIHLQMANCLIQKDRNEQAKAQLLIIKQNFMSDKQQLQEELLLQTAKYFLEIDQHQYCINILEKLNQSQNNSPQIIYLLAFCAFKMKKYQLCKDYITEYPEGQTEDAQVADAMAELKTELAKVGKFNYETEEGMDDEEWEDVEDMEDN